MNAQLLAPSTAASHCISGSAAEIETALTFLTSPVIFLSTFLFTISSSLFLPFTVIPSIGMFPVENRRRGDEQT